MAGILARHKFVAQVVLESIARVRGKATADAAYGLTGGNALLAYELTTRGTMDVDIAVSRMLGDWKDLEAAIEAGLAASGYVLEPIDKTAGLDAFAADGEEIGLSEWEVQAPGGGEIDQLQVSHFDLLAAPVIMPGIGPVLALEDVAGWKTVAFANRRFARDACDVAALLTTFTTQELIALAQARDPGLQAADFADAGQYVDRARDEALAAVLDGTGREVAWVRSQLRHWPRTAPPRRDTAGGPF